MAPRSGTFSLVWRIALVLAVASGLAWWILSQTHDPRVARAPEHDADVAPPEPEPEPHWLPRERREPAPGCEPRADRTCLGGDVWWVDSCGEVHDEAEECGLRLCVDGACEEAEGCGDVRPPGHCEGDVAQVCPGGHVIEIDCTDTGQRCVMDDDGPICIDPPDEACDWPPGLTKCDADVLTTCRRGGVERIDCAALDAKCVDTGPAARCVARVPPVATTDGCGPCGCDEAANAEEICDGRDNDGDGWIDEDGCAPIDIVAFVVSDDDDEMSYTVDELDAELKRINAAFARDDDYGLEFRLADKVRLRDPDLLVLDEGEYDNLVDTMRYPEEEGFFIPILFTNEVYIAGVPRPGVSTVPNGSCGGQRRDRAYYPELGLIAIAKRRWPTTVAHEIGHYLGLCHTHGDQPAPIQRVASVDGEDVACGDNGCALDPDGVCDTPLDPGPQVCSADPECIVQCPRGEHPDSRNLMSYYTACRNVFSQQQTLLMRRSLALRHQWFHCKGASCECQPGAGQCPPEMSCRGMSAPEGAQLWRCGMDGASLPGGTCKEPRDCGGHSMCMQVPSGLSLCVRPCNDQTLACTCTDLPGNPWPICIEDTSRANPAPPPAQ